MKSAPSKLLSQGWSHSRRGGFTLVELLWVVVLLAVLAGLVAPAIIGMKGANSATRAIYEIVGQLEQARAYAVANNTYVMVGIAEVDASAPSVPGAQTPGVGRVLISTVASRDGTKIFDETSVDLGDDWKKKTDKGSGLIQLNKLLYFENLHLSSTLTSSPGLDARPAVEQAYRLGNSQCSSVLTFAYPVEQSPGPGICAFSKVIQFNPQGGACVLRNDNFGVVAPWIEIGLIPTRGTVVVADKNEAAIQINGLTGAVSIYRP